MSVKVDERDTAIIFLTLVKTAEAGTIVKSPLWAEMADAISKSKAHGYYCLPHLSRTKVLSRSHPVPYQMTESQPGSVDPHWVGCGRHSMVVQLPPLLCSTSFLLCHRLDPKGPSG